MKKLIVIALALIGYLPLSAQTKKKPTNAKPAKQVTETPVNTSLPAMNDVILRTQANVDLLTANMGNNAHERDVNTIIKDIQRYLDSAQGPRTRADVLLTKNYTPLRSFYLTTTNKTTVATAFLYADAPYTYAMHNDGLALHIGAVKSGETYDLGMKTEKGIIRTALLNCLLPSLNAFSEFRDTDIKYVGLSIYYGCSDSREEGKKVTPYTLTLVAPLADVIQYAAGDMTAKNLLASSELYQADAMNRAILNRVYIDINDNSDEVIPRSPARTVIIGPLPDVYMEVK
ncbi:hypothetical protein GCM10023093_02240 [Nemorincola caseinilytica]|uniref:Uncharacterized protein n=1 Tax=Nemorincola caseinilytica TaxID=2054315 RepID=A0ABP8N583_9BACT